MITSETYKISSPPFVAGSFLQDFDLSQNKSLRTIEVTALSIAWRHGSCTPDSATLGLLGTTFSKLTSPAFSEVIVFYQDFDFGGLTLYPRHTPNIYRAMTPAESSKQDLWHRGLFEAFREMYTVRDFQLVLCVDVWDRVGDYTMGVMRRAVAEEKAAGRLDSLLSEPVVVYNPRGYVERV